MSLSQLSAGPGQTLPVADLDRRFYAFAVDRLLVLSGYGGAVALGWWASGGLWWGALSALTLAGLLVVTLGALMLVGGGATPGKRLMDLRVIDQGAGRPLTFGAAWGRTFVLELAGLPTLGFGVAALAWTALVDQTGRRRGWHDVRSGAVVVDVRPVPEPLDEAVEEPRQVVNLTALRLVPVKEPVRPLPRPPVRQPSAPTPAAQPAQAPPAPTPQARPPAPAPQARPPAPAPQARPPAPASRQPEVRTVVRGSAAPPQSGMPGPVPRAAWRLTLDTGDFLVVEGLVLLGRRPAPRQGEIVRHLVPLPSRDMSVSKTHAQIGPAPDGTLVVMDRGSTNGSLLMRQGVPRELPPGRPITLVPGDRVRFGDREVVISRDA